ncbi:MAG TPA: hypothetical protein PKA28_17010 [Methylomusa anaerophila]|uniref:Uncharacterized protein n=1 Tax=Methylomusa anaerophila TaxID=1930071 RepID=A0A348AK38_9FIRM|nr:hypothetical protein [Methylomusa anaerophila]BBB91436.1 hypothetical protein MAMMFC1_02120 [Methylomusa anaerophila]HML90142.1 hypothetical protein [Methylomusa anaerophila]
MSKQHLSDFQIGYDYARHQHDLLGEYTPQNILELAMIFCFQTGNTAELAKGMGVYYLELGIKKIIAQFNCHSDQSKDFTVVHKD